MVLGVLRSFRQAGTADQRAEAERLEKLLTDPVQFSTPEAPLFDAGQGPGFAPDGSPVNERGEIIEG
jgi:hypothetical protein